MKPDIQVQADNGKEYVLVYLGTRSLTNPAIETGRLLKLLRSGDLEKADPEHPLLYALQGVKNRHALTLSIKQAHRLILIKKKGSPRTALVKENITGAGLDIAQRFLNTGTP
jgi:hypothetical protein